MRVPYAAKSSWTGLAAAILAVAVATAAIFPLKSIAPSVSLGVIYLLPVLIISVFWSIWIDLFTAALSAVSFNYFHIEPTGSLSINTPENIVALFIFLAAAVITSTLAEISRKSAREAERRRLEADVTAEMARELLGGRGAGESLPEASARLASMLDLPWARIGLGAADAGGEIELPLEVGTGRRALLDLPPDIDAERLEWIEGRIAPALAAVLKAALERDELLDRAIESEALRRSDDLKTSLIRSVSHDLRSPLAAIVTSGEALREPGLNDEERAEMSAAVVDEASRLSRLVTNLLDLSRIESGAADPRADWCALDEVVETAAEEARRRDPAAPVRIVTEGDPGLFRVDASQIERIMVNLIENAQRYSAPEPVTVTLRPDGRGAVIRVVDRGPGISLADRERIFDPFERGDERDGHRGSGLGLTIARGFALANGGTLRAESLPGQGSAFVLEIPAERGTDG